MRRLLILVALSAATVAAAHEGVKNPAVMARMNGMSAIAESVEVLGKMAKGATPFDAADAGAATVSIAKHAAEAPKLFEERAEDQKSEALPAIWENFDDFTAKSLELETIALRLSTSIKSIDDLPPALKRLGANCTSCHEVYRKP